MNSVFPVRAINGRVGPYTPERYIQSTKAFNCFIQLRTDTKMRHVCDLIENMMTQGGAV